ncbi:hypothetical protein CBR_g57073 [Chara braunii]|uniref:DNA mismatch repair proteins mutS family domain-containing protein n=1 Tax=Chara braunii TaxID=69332 RepID=A0A388K809_CHABU|nr:hypothetical protein CBR_g57073 [Chara braunii]|eukprot:GBG66194.1 hypothetical protein CBR_g57073 [Chara braunii]
MGGCRLQFVDAAEVSNNAASLSPSKREGEREGNDAHGEAVALAAGGEGDAVVAKGRGTAEPDGNDGTTWVLCLEKTRHPLLMQQHREGIRKARGRAKMKERATMMAKMRGGGLYVVTEAEQTAAEAETEAEALATTPPVPIDVCVQRGVRVVIITGPNTGGKTASLKTIALATLMAKAGLYVLAQDPVRISWFDKVLPDIGDDRSLSQSLSMFSGHIRRSKAQRLGSHFFSRLHKNGPSGSLLAMSTTHHGELKALKYVDSRFENASVEFDVDKLAPTYRQLWGIPGRSNALNIAWKLGVLMSIIDEARRLHGSTNAEVNEVIMNMENERRRYEGTISQAEELLEEAERMHSDVKQAVLRLQQHQAEFLLRRSDEIQSVVQATQSSIQSSLRKARNKRRKQLAAPVAKESSEGQQRDEQPVGMDRTRGPSQQDANNKADSKSLADEETLRQEKGTMDRTEGAAATTFMCIPKVGEMVVVQRLKMEGRVLTLSEAKKEVTVQFLDSSIKELNRRARIYLWTGDPNKDKGISKIAWHYVTRRPRDGGLGIIDPGTETKALQIK